MVIICLIFWRTARTVFCSSRTILYSNQWCMRVQISPYPCPSILFDLTPFLILRDFASLNCSKFQSIFNYPIFLATSLHLNKYSLLEKSPHVYTTLPLLVLPPLASHSLLYLEESVLHLPGLPSAPVKPYRHQLTCWVNLYIRPFIPLKTLKTDLLNG